MKRNILSLAFAVLCAVVTLSSCLGNDNPKPEPLTPEQIRIRHIASCVYRFKISNPAERYYWERKTTNGQTQHVQIGLLLNDTKLYSVIKLDDPSKLPAVDESKGIYATGKLMDDTKKIIHRGSRPTEKKEDLDALDKKLYWVVSKHIAQLDEKTFVYRVPYYFTRGNEERGLTDAICVQLTKPEHIELLKWYASRLLLDIVAQSPTDPLMYVLSAKYSGLSPLLIADILYQDTEIFKDAYPFFYSTGWSIYSPKARP